MLEKGLKDTNGNSIMLPRPNQPSSKEELPLLPKISKEEKTTQSKLTTPIGSLNGKQLFDKTKDYAKQLGFEKIEFFSTTGNTTGTYSEKIDNGGVGFAHYPGHEHGNAMTFVVSDWSNQIYKNFFEKLLETYGVDSSIVVKEIDDLKVNSGDKIELQGKVMSFNKRTYVDDNNKVKVSFTVRDW